MMSSPDSNNIFGEAKQHVDAILFDGPDLFKGVDEAEREKIIKAIGAQARLDFENSLSRIKELIRRCNPLQALAHLEYYDGTMLDTPICRQRSADAEYEPVQQFAIEFFQALFLSTPISELPVHVTPPEVLIEVNKTLHKLGESYMMLNMGDDWDDDEVTANHKSLARNIRHHTFAVRNAGFQNQVVSQLKGLFAPLDDTFESRTGVRLSALVTMWENLSRRYAKKINDDRMEIHKAFRAPSASEIIGVYVETRKLDVETLERLMRVLERSDGSLDAAKAVCFDHYDKTLMEFYRYELDDFVQCYPTVVNPEKLRLILWEWTLPIEALVGSEVERLLLDNPIWKRPIISHPEITWFFWPIPQLFHSFGLEMLEHLLSKHPDLETLYQSKLRGEYLEGAVVRHLETTASGAKIYRNVEWTDPASKRAYETDVFLLLDDVAVIVECKSGKVTPPARRGAPDRVRKEVRKLIEDASEQSFRLVELLKHSSSPVRLKPKKQPQVTLEAKAIRKFIRLNITLDFFGPLACDVRAMQTAGMLSTRVAGAPTIALVDFENILHLLPNFAQQLHYFARRAEIEQNLALEGDELDLLAFYMATGFNLGDFEFESSRKISFANLGGQLEPYLFARSAGIEVTKPKPKLTGRWWRILNAFASRRFKGWLHASFILLSVGYEDQEEFEQFERKMFFTIASSQPREDELNVIVSTNGPKQRRTGLISIGVRSVDREQRIRLIENALGKLIEQESVEEVLFLCHNVFDLMPPYLAAGIHVPKLR